MHIKSQGSASHIRNVTEMCLCYFCLYRLLPTCRLCLLMTTVYSYMSVCINSLFHLHSEGELFALFVYGNDCPISSPAGSSSMFSWLPQNNLGARHWAQLLRCHPLMSECLVQYLPLAWTNVVIFLSSFSCFFSHCIHIQSLLNKVEFLRQNSGHVLLCLKTLQWFLIMCIIKSKLIVTAYKPDWSSPRKCFFQPLYTFCFMVLISE